MNLFQSIVKRKYKPLIVFVGILGLYLPVQTILLLVTGDDSTLSVSVVPILFSGWFMGPWWAAIAGGCIGAYFVVVKIISLGLDAWIDIAVGGGSIAIFSLVGIAIGRVEQLNRLLRQELEARKVAELALESRTQQLARSNKELEQFAYIASHDLQEPLRKISAFGSRLSSKYAGVLDAQGLDYLSRMQNAALRMQSLIEGLLAYSRVTTKAQPFSSVDLSIIASEVLVDLETKIKDAAAVSEPHRQRAQIPRAGGCAHGECPRGDGRGNMQDYRRRQRYRVRAAIRGADFRRVYAASRPQQRIRGVGHRTFGMQKDRGSPRWDHWCPGRARKGRDVYG